MRQVLQTWSLELSYFLGAMGCSNHLDVRNCNNPAEENNYADYVNLESTRRAIHVGDIPFGAQVRSILVQQELLEYVQICHGLI